MSVSVSFFGLHRMLAQTDRIEVPLSSKIKKVADLFSYIRENYPSLPLHRDMVLVTVNNHVSSFDRRLQVNDEISFIPHIGGG
ncbi:MAG: MoaD/ThiS family protein [Deltaproteobacteria bacterium]|nr:MoaD/ThiS family protein [Deltaproteobacteria bacterium]